MNCFNKCNFLIGGTVLLCHTRQNCLCVNRCDPLSEFIFHFLRFGEMKNNLDLLKYSGKTEQNQEKYVQMSLMDDSDIVVED